MTKPKETGAKPGRLNIVIQPEDDARLVALHAILSKRLGKRITYAVVVRYALAELARTEGVKAA
jgi:hypothetical protein